MQRPNTLRGKRDGLHGEDPDCDQRAFAERQNDAGVAKVRAMMRAPGSRSRWFAGAIGIAGALIGLGLLVPALQQSAPIGGAFTLVGENGKTVSSDRFRNRYELIYFGYTHCPDLCPLTLAHIAAAVQSLGPAGARIVPIFITIDPRRDTPDAMQRYTSQFSGQIVGLTGSPAQIADVARDFHVYDRRVAAMPGNAGYAMDHSSSLYLIGPTGRFITAFQPPASTAGLVAALERFVGHPRDAAS
jgi:cytochrome oxidase Cu insertion factor (SCO1/SenC/PrrC family)